MLFNDSAPRSRCVCVSVFSCVCLCSLPTFLSRVLSHMPCPYGLHTRTNTKPQPNYPHSSLILRTAFSSPIFGGRENCNTRHTPDPHTQTHTHTHIPGPANGITAAGNSGPRRGHHLSGMEEEEEMVMVAVHEEEEEKCLFKANAMIELDADCNHATHERVRRKFIQS